MPPARRTLDSACGENFQVSGDSLRIADRPRLTDPPQRPTSAPQNPLNPDIGHGDDIDE